MSKLTTPPQSEADQIAAVQEALRLQELDAVEREQELENIRAEVHQLRKEKQDQDARMSPLDLAEATFFVDDNEYQFLVKKLNFGYGRILTVQEMIEQPETLRQLVRDGSDSIQLVNQ
jgi:adenine C2-methylase RlmN of 23S rRNA A2503 and tRNA A37